jgi:hypothetical protein
MTSRAHASETKKRKEKEGEGAGWLLGWAGVGQCRARARGDDWAEPAQFGPVSPTLFFLNNFFLF